MCLDHHYHHWQCNTLYQLVRHRAHPDNHQMSTCLNCADISLLCFDNLDHCNCFPCFGSFYHMVYSIVYWSHRHKDQFPNQQCKDSNPSSSRFLQYEYIGYLNENVLIGWVSADEMFMMFWTLTVCRDILRDFAGKSSRGK